MSDLARSRAFYDKLFGLPVAAEVPPGADSATREKLGLFSGGLLYKLGDGLLVLRPVADRADEHRVGLDHISLAVSSKADLDEAISTLDAEGISHGEIEDLGDGWVLQFRDPDDIPMELFAVK